MEKVIALVPLKATSLRLKNKNLRLIGGETLLERKLRILKQCKNVKKIIVSSDLEEILKIAVRTGAETFKQDKYFSTTTTLINEVVPHIYSNIEGEHIMWTQVTNPLVSAQTFDTAIQEYFTKLKEGYDSLATYIPLKEMIWDENGPLNYNKNKMPRSQDLKILKQLNFAMMIMPRKLAIEKKYYMGDKPYFFEMSHIEGIDIDYEWQLFAANSFLARESLIDIYKNEP